MLKSSVFIALALAVLSWRTAIAQWTVINLHPMGASESAAYTVDGAYQAGYVRLTPGGGARASLWTGAATSWASLHSTGGESAVFHGQGNQQVGYASSGGAGRAVLWTGTPSSMISLHPVGATESLAYGVYNGQQVGFVTLGGVEHASVWNGTSTSWVDLNPAGSTGSEAFSNYAGQQVGFVTVSGARHASRWSGTADSWEDLNPQGAMASFARCAFAGRQVGYAYTGVVPHAILWNGTALFCVDLNPSGASASAAVGMDANQQVGFSTFGEADHAGMWTGTAASWIDLSLFLTGLWGNTYAQGIYSDATATYVAGYGTNRATNRTEALMWVGPPPCGSGLIRDCNGHCAPVSWVGDGLCDDGFYSYNGYSIRFDCQEFRNDGGACNSPPPPIVNPPNHGAPATPPHYDPPTPTQPSQNKLVLVTHGWNTSFETYAALWAPLRNVIAARVGPDWKVESYDWTSDSGSLDPYFGPDYALVLAAIHGRFVGESIVARGFTHVHLIAHSAGSALIATAAKRIKELNQNITVHTTYLDAYAGAFPGFEDYVGAYGSNADWSDYYYSREPTLDICISQESCLGTYPTTGPFTEQYLPNSFNLDVSSVDPNYDGPFCPLVSESLSSHGWPPRFYRFTVDGSVGNSNCLPPNGATIPYGFPLSLEAVGGSAQAWISNMNAAYPKGDVRSLPEGGGAGSSEFRAPRNPPTDLSLVPSYRSDPDAVLTTGGVLSMTTQPQGAQAPAPAWINFQITTTTPVNFVAFDMALSSAAGAAGVVSVYIDGTKRGLVDERYTRSGTQPYAMPTPGELAPGDHFVSLRLDPSNGVPSSLIVTNLATGRSTFAPRCTADFNGDGDLGTDQDIGAFFACLGGSCCPTCGSADFNGDGDLGTDADIESFFRVLGGGPC